MSAFNCVSRRLKQKQKPHTHTMHYCNHCAPQSIHSCYFQEKKLSVEPWGCTTMDWLTHLLILMHPLYASHSVSTTSRNSSLSAQVTNQTVSSQPLKYSELSSPSLSYQKATCFQLPRVAIKATPVPFRKSFLGPTPL